MEVMVKEGVLAPNQSRGSSVKPRRADASSSGSMATLSDIELVHELSSGGDAGFARFYDRLANPLFSIIRQIVLNQNDAEDALQEAFLQMWKTSSRFSPERGTLFTWAITIARHKAIDRVRRRNRQQRTSDLLAQETIAVPPATTQAPLARVALADEYQRVAAAFASLSAGERQAIELAFFRGLTHAQISRELEVPLGTIKARIRRGLLALRNALQLAERASPARFAA